MGLDMYLKGKRWITNWPEQPEESKLSSVISELFPNNVKVTSVTADVGYWRKANAIHNWFVTNVQDGKDDCEEYDVSREQLDQLSQQCKIVLGNASLASSMLPSLGGFFFGGVDYDENYMSDLRDTITIIDNTLELDKQWSFSYMSSW
jgi:hypothetical protein